MNELIGKVYNTNSFGKLLIKNYIDYENVIVRFIDTGFETTARIDSIRNGSVKDWLSPSVCGIGFFGRKPLAGETKTQAYRVWHGIIVRCYSEKHQSMHPSYIGCSVINEWHNFQNFKEWFDKHYTKGLEVDKDIKVAGNRVYGPDTCIMVSKKRNIEHAFAKNYKFKDPEGNEVNVYNLRQFCIDNKLSNQHMGSVSRGSRARHKGWTRA